MKLKKFLILTIISFWYCSYPEKQIEKPKNVILMIGDGMGITQIAAGFYSSSKPLNFTRFKNIGLMTNHSYDNIVTDSAASATAMATGEKSYNNAISVNPQKVPIKSIFEIAKEKGYSIGVVVTNSVTDATPAAFLAHSESRENHYEIAKDILDLEPDIVIGGGKKFFINRPDNENLLEKFKEKNYEIYLDFNEFQKSNFEDTNKKILGIFAETGLPPVVKTKANSQSKYFEYLSKNTDFNSSRNQEYLSIASKKAMEYLEKKGKPFILLVEGSQIDYGGHNMDANYTINELLDFDKAIGEVLNFAERTKNTLVVVTADHETGGFTITGGNIKTLQIESKYIYEKHTATLVGVFAYGPSSEEFIGFFDNTDIFKKIKKLLF